MDLAPTDERHLLRAIALAASARAAGNHPFGSLIVDATGESALEGENTVVTLRDVTGHAELNVVRAAGIECGDAFLQGFAPDLLCEVLAGVASFRVGQRTDDVTLVALHRSAERVSSGLDVVAMDTVIS